MGGCERREIKAPWPTPDGLDCDVWQLTPTCAVCIEDPNGPHPVAYEYEIESRPCWTLRQVYALTPDEVWRMVGGRGRMGGDEASMIYLAFCRAARRDLSAYWTDSPKPPTCGERCRPEPQKPQASGSALDLRPIEVEPPAAARFNSGT